MGAPLSEHDAVNYFLNKLIYAVRS